MTDSVRNITHTICSDAHVQKWSGRSKKVDPTLKLIYRWSVLITDNLDVENSIANGVLSKYLSGNQIKRRCRQEQKKK